MDEYKYFKEKSIKRLENMDTIKLLYKVEDLIIEYIDEEDTSKPYIKAIDEAIICLNKIKRM